MGQQACCVAEISSMTLPEMGSNKLHLLLHFLSKAYFLLLLE